MTGPGPEGGASKSSPTSSQPEPGAERTGIAAFCAAALGTKYAAPTQRRQARRRCDKPRENLDMEAPLSSDASMNSVATTISQMGDMPFERIDPLSATAASAFSGHERRRLRSARWPQRAVESALPPREAGWAPR